MFNIVISSFMCMVYLMLFDGSGEQQQQQNKSTTVLIFWKNLPFTEYLAKISINSTVFFFSSNIEIQISSNALTNLQSTHFSKIQ